MDIHHFFILLKKELSKMPHSYDRLNEGKVYLGPLVINRNDYSEEDYRFFCYYLCLFVSFDLLIFTYNLEEYEMVKKSLGIPKFEFGLTNTFYYPNDLFHRLNGSISERCFTDAFSKFIEFLRNKNFEFNFETILRKTLIDKNFDKGLFSKFFKDEIMKI